MKIKRALYDEIVAHAHEEAPNECVGVIATANGDAVEVLRATNAAASPLRYEIDAQELYRLHTSLEERGYELGAIYHSHTRSEPVPSQTDINLAFYPDALYIIVGLKDAEPDTRAYTIRDGQVAQAELQIAG